MNLIVKPVEGVNEVVVKGVEFNYKAGNVPQKAAVPFFVDGVRLSMNAGKKWRTVALLRSGTPTKADIPLP